MPSELYAEKLCKLIHDAIKKEEQALKELQGSYPVHDPPRQLLSVAVAGELAIGYLVRKQALKSELLVECEVRYRNTGGRVDFCLVDHTSRKPCVACELKYGGIWEKVSKFVDDTTKLFDPKSDILEAGPDCERYCAWILVDNQGLSAGEVEDWVKKMLKDALHDIKIVSSEPIPINTCADGSPFVDKWRNAYRLMHVVVLSGVLTSSEEQILACKS